MSDYKSYWIANAGGLQIHPNRGLQIHPNRGQIQDVLLNEVTTLSLQRADDRQQITA